MAKRGQYTITPSCNNCDYKNKSISKEPCVSCSDLSNWRNKAREEIDKK